MMIFMIILEKVERATKNYLKLSLVTVWEDLLSPFLEELEVEFIQKLLM